MTKAQEALTAVRQERFKPKGSRGRAPRRNAFERDVDRIVASRSFARLGRVTQVALAHDTLSLHNRYSHSIRVAGIAKRIAARLIDRQGSERCSAGTVADHLNVDVVEAAALAHDIGHPPFGHVGERVLERLVTEEHEGFEGNAQTFRHLTRLEEYEGAKQGLGLTRATLRAVLKYPVFRSGATKTEDDPHLKFGAYSDDAEAFAFAMDYGFPGNQQSLEASVMDIADDIAYGIHDLEDFYRADLIPMDHIRLQMEIDKYKTAMRLLWEQGPESRVESAPVPSVDKYLSQHAKSQDAGGDELTFLLRDFPIWSGDDPESPLRSLDQPLTRWRSRLVRYFITNTKSKCINGHPVARLLPQAKMRMTALKELTRKHVHSSPHLLSQQAGLEIIATHLFDWLCPPVAPGGCITDTDHLETISRLLPRWARSHARSIIASGDSEVQTGQWIRLAADVVSSLDDSEAVRLAHRIRGTATGSLKDGVW